MKAVEDRLSVNSDIGGIARYEADAYQRGEGYDGLPGNPWIISTLWLAQWKIAGASDLEDLERVTGLLEWTVSRAAPSGILPEQAHPVSGRPLSVAPLTWSHAAFVSAVLDYMERLEKVYVCASCGAPLHRHDPRRPAAAQGGDR
jgi:GH15 family glucan-1,4-alpha-glucosidase